MSETTTTPNYGLIKPNVNADADLWGDHWNQNADTLDSKIKAVENKAGVVTWNTRSGAVTLSQADVTTVLPPGAGTPAMDGTATPGALNTWSRSDHVHPVDTSRYAASNPAGYVTASGAATAAPVQSVAARTGAVTLTHTDITDWATSLAPYAPLASPTFTGTPALPTGTTAVTQAPGDATTKVATTAFVGTALGGVPGGAIVAATPPTASPGALWWDSVGGQLYVRYDDGNTVQWVTTDNIAGLANAATKTDVAAAQNNAGRNVIHNSGFTVQQRGVGPWTTFNSTFTADRWRIDSFGVADTISFSLITLTDADRSQIGDETAQTALQNVFTGNAAAGAGHTITQPMERVRRFTGKTLTLSLWAKSATGTPKLGVNFYLQPGTGGSPSAGGYTQATGQAITLSTTWTRYALSFTIPSAAGLTLGTNGNDWLGLALAYSSGATNNAVFGNIGVQSGTVQLWGIQLELGSVATPLDYGGSPQRQLAECQRFYQSLIGMTLLAGSSGSFGGAIISTPFPVTMRTSPTLVFNMTGGSASANSVVGNASSTVITYSFGSAQTLGMYANFNVTASADL